MTDFGPRCTWLGPCPAIEARIREGWARFQHGHLTIPGGFWLETCPWCGSTLDAAALSMWPWQRYASERTAGEPQADGES